MSGIVNGYTTRDALIRSLAANSGNKDIEADDAINAASRAIDAHCGRSFYLTSSETRVFVPSDSEWCTVDDLVTITSVKGDSAGAATYSTTWATTDYLTYPLNGRQSGITGWPITSLRAIDRYSFSCSARVPYVQIVGTWGWAAIPTAVETACRALAASIVKRHESPGGLISGYQDFGGMHVPNDLANGVKAELAVYCRIGGTGLPGFA